MRMEPQKLDELLHPVFDKAALKRAKVVAKGLPASPGLLLVRLYSRLRMLKLGLKRRRKSFLYVSKPLQRTFAVWL